MKINKEQVSLILKRIFDVIISGMALALFSIFIVFGLFIKFDSYGIAFLYKKSGESWERNYDTEAVVFT